MLRRNMNVKSQQLTKHQKFVNSGKNKIKTIT